MLTKWNEIKKYLSDGINLIAVDKDKKPLADWKKYQTQKITEEELYYQFDKGGAEGAAFVLGKISKNLFVIDIDSKYKNGFESIYFKDIKEILPEVWIKLRIHKTPSGGCHIIYHITDPPPASKKLASRYMTPEEEADHRARHPKDRSKELTKCFLETRGEGALSGAPPSAGYTVYKDEPIPTLSVQEHEQLIALGQTYNEVIKVEKPFTVSIYQSDHYEENPFDDYNASTDGENVLEDNGWIVAKRSNLFTWYTRPDGKKGDIHASFNKSKRVFFIFTTSTNLDSEKGYKPATILSHFKFHGNKKETYKHLVNCGFGKVREKIQKAAVKKMARAGITPPANYSPEIKKEITELAENLKALHPFGNFWTHNDKGEGVSINRPAFYTVANGLGFYLLNKRLVKKLGNILHEADERDIFDAMSEYVKEPDEIERFEILHSLEAFLQTSGKFSITRLPMIDKSKLLRDTRVHCYKFFDNGIIRISADELNAISYDEIKDKFIEARKIKPRDFTLDENVGIYEEFLNKATKQNEKGDYVKKIVGYLAHEYRDETTGFIIVITEECLDPKDGGGSGKNLFCNLLKETTTLHARNGGQITYDDKFFQGWSGERVMSISDAQKGFRFDFLKEPSTGTFIHKKLYRDEIEIPVEDGPKFIVHTNFSYELSDGGLKRRIIPLEFTDFFTKAKGVNKYYGMQFPNGWTLVDWNRFDTFIIGAVQLWLQSNLELEVMSLSKTGQQKQFEQSFGKHLTEFIGDNIDGWINTHKVKSSEIQDSFVYYLNVNAVPQMYRPSKNRVADSIKEFCKMRKIHLETNKPMTVNGVLSKYYVFGISDSDTTIIP